MEYNLKKENKKKFQDSSRLKRHHKKNYNKVIHSASIKSAQASSSESEDEYDPDGNIVEKEGVEYEDVFDETGRTIRRRKKKDSIPNNAWRFKDDIHINGLDDEDDSQLSGIDFRKLNLPDLDSEQKNKKIDIKRMSTKELTNLQIGGSEYGAINTSSSPKIEPLKETHSYQNLSRNTVEDTQASHVPVSLRTDESFLDDLI